MTSLRPEGLRALIDESAASIDPCLPAFIARPKDAPAYYGFPLLDGSECDGFVFGVITSPAGDQPVSWGDAYVVAPNGSRAGLIWRAGYGEPKVVCAPDEGRWGVYCFSFSNPIQSKADLVACLHEVLPQIKEYYEKASQECPASTEPRVLDKLFDKK